MVGGSGEISSLPLPPTIFVMITNHFWQLYRRNHICFNRLDIEYLCFQNYDACTVAKSWVKDVNTLCIEKLSVFDEQPELLLHVQTLYCLTPAQVRRMEHSVEQMIR